MGSVYHIHLSPFEGNIYAVGGDRRRLDDSLFMACSRVSHMLLVNAESCLAELHLIVHREVVVESGGRRESSDVEVESDSAIKTRIDTRLQIAPVLEQYFLSVLVFWQHAIHGGDLLFKFTFSKFQTDSAVIYCSRIFM